MVDEFAGNIRGKFQWSDSLTPLAERMAGILVENSRYDVLESLDSVSRELGVPLPFADSRSRMWLAAYVIHLASMKKRQAAIGALIPVGVETFGDPDGWRKLFGDAIHTHPNVDYRRELASVYRNILVNVNITSCQMPTAVNQRVFDIPLASSFVITDRQPDLAELFDESEVATYGSTKELAEKAAFFVGHQSERDRIATAAKAHILGEHTYEHRVKSILAAIP
jgi:spore maturation protein CgeB